MNEPKPEWRDEVPPVVDLAQVEALLFAMKPRSPNGERVLEYALRYVAGESMKDIGREQGISGSRVSQLILRMTCKNPGWGNTPPNQEGRLRGYVRRWGRTVPELEREGELSK